MKPTPWPTRPWTPAGSFSRLDHFSGPDRDSLQFFRDKFLRCVYHEGVRSRGDNRVSSNLMVREVRGKSELHRAGCWLTARGSDPTESATENIPLRLPSQ